MIEEIKEPIKLKILSEEALKEGGLDKFLIKLFHEMSGFNILF